MPYSKGRRIFLQEQGCAAAIQLGHGGRKAGVGLGWRPQRTLKADEGGWQTDMVLLGREMLRNPYWPLTAAQALGQATSWPKQYLRAAPAGSAGR